MSRLELVETKNNDWDFQVSSQSGGHGRGGQIKEATTLERWFGRSIKIESQDKHKAYFLNRGSLIDYLNTKYHCHLRKGFQCLGASSDSEIQEAFFYALKNCPKTTELEQSKTQTIDRQDINSDAPEKIEAEGSKYFIKDFQPETIREFLLKNGTTLENGSLRLGKDKDSEDVVLNSKELEDFLLEFKDKKSVDSYTLYQDKWFSFERRNCRLYYSFEPYLTGYKFRLFLVDDKPLGQGASYIVRSAQQLLVGDVGRRYVLKEEFTKKKETQKEIEKRLALGNNVNKESFFEDRKYRTEVKVKIKTTGIQDVVRHPQLSKDSIYSLYSLMDGTLKTLKINDSKTFFDVAIQVFRGIVLIHEKGLAHGDIRDENILFKREGDVITVQIADLSGMEDCENIEQIHASTALWDKKQLWTEREKWVFVEHLQNHKKEDMWKFYQKMDLRSAFVDLYLCIPRNWLDQNSSIGKFYIELFNEFTTETTAQGVRDLLENFQKRIDNI